jgi:mono/diheme cytochrome c family protein
MNPRALVIGCALFAALSSVLFAQKQAAVPADSKLIESLDGADLFLAYCASCHGKDGKGHGPAAPSLTKTPADLTKISARNGGTYPLLKVQQMIGGQSAIVVSHGNREMPVWGPIFSQVARDQDFGTLRIYNVAKYLESIQSPK